MLMAVEFKPISTDIAAKLLAFVDRRNLGKSVEIDGTAYVLDFISQNSSAFWQSRGLSVYFRTADSVVRISDHWGASIGNDRSRKLNCGMISGKRWVMSDPAPRISFNRYAGKYPWVMLAGVVDLATIRQSCDHFSE